MTTPDSRLEQWNGPRICPRKVAAIGPTVLMALEPAEAVERASCTPDCPGFPQTVILLLAKGNYLMIDYCQNFNSEDTTASAQ